jgi:thiosulfate/3-mercaptopyruvate sulfurtransferase
MPGAFNVPFDTLLNDEKNKLRSREEMISIFENAGVDVNTEKDIICSCGSGVTACWIALALEECGRDPTKTFLYDGSWIEWASDESNPVVKEE